MAEILYAEVLNDIKQKIRTAWQRALLAVERSDCEQNVLILQQYNAQSFIACSSVNERVVRQQ